MFKSRWFLFILSLILIMNGLTGIIQLIKGVYLSWWDITLTFLLLFAGISYFIDSFKQNNRAEN
ncbi:hypothetical protein [Alkalicoccobacillus gibsonii]|uniref:hypothetical protein n=1 Tax=Alkalicoccobacillus gibsonii TaxID=79881 RepID=UPI001932BF92|nr:hypothetical protein [Alkalicoccobacillus gibsonii]MBM0065514.1 hypothetical protein [Alkalicoccobacillus gibsonii]